MRRLFQRVGLIGAVAVGVLRCSPVDLPASAQSSTAASENTSGLPVFPGAEGFGTRTRAGRGGKVVAVTSLADSGPGTLRAALEDPAPKIIVFRVGGTIELKSLLFVRHPFVTIAGQTAPGDGIGLKDFGLVIITNDVLIQHIRVRPGDKGQIKAEENDAIAILGKHGNVTGSHNVVIDHVSASWGEDETVSTWFGAHDVTVSWSIVSEGLNRSRHPKGTHSGGLLVGNGSNHVSVHHNLLAHNEMRNPLLIGGGTHDVVNNVIYDWGTLATEVVNNGGDTRANIVGNYYRRGPSTRTSYEVMVNPAGTGVPSLFVAGNARPGSDSSWGTDWSTVQSGWKSRGAPAQYRAPRRFDTAAITVSDAQRVLAAVLEGAGATLPRRDSVDMRIVQDVRSGTGSIIDSPSQVGGHPRYAGGPAPPDGDGDGMPDAWERQHGLDPANGADGAADRNGDGYTNIEEYLQALVTAR